MSQHDSASHPGRPAVQKQGLSVYTMMLIISFIAIFIGCVLLYMELNRFGTYPWWNTRDAQPRRATSYLERLPSQDHSFGWANMPSPADADVA